MGDIHHCRRCPATWTGTTKAHCNVCHETFASNGVADLHWLKREGHQHPATLPARLRVDEAGVWHSAKRRPIGTITQPEGSNTPATADDH